MIQVRSGEDLVLRLVDGEDLVAALAELAIDSGVILSGIGMVKKVRLGYWTGESYEEHRVDDPGELLSMQGNFATGPEGRVVHCHLTIARRDGGVCGGHLIEAKASTTTEIVIRTLPGVRLVRKPEATGLLGLYPETSS
jgi:predicted DNA-binding protein with PD1-like motif